MLGNNGFGCRCRIVGLSNSCCLSLSTWGLFFEVILTLDFRVLCRSARFCCRKGRIKRVMFGLLFLLLCPGLYCRIYFALNIRINLWQEVSNLCNYDYEIRMILSFLLYYYGLKYPFWLFFIKFILIFLLVLSIWE